MVLAVGGRRYFESQVCHYFNLVPSNFLPPQTSPLPIPAAALSSPNPQPALRVWAFGALAQSEERVPDKRPQYWIIRGKFPASRGSIFLVTAVTVALIITSLVVVVTVDPSAFEKRR